MLSAAFQFFVKFLSQLEDEEGEIFDLAGAGNVERWRHRVCPIGILFVNVRLKRRDCDCFLNTGF